MADNHQNKKIYLLYLKAIGMPRATFDAEYLHRSIPAMAAAYLFHLCQNHPFLDGNKRAGANAAITFLLINDWEPVFDEEQLVAVVMAVAAEGMAKADVVTFFEAHCQPASGAPSG